MDFASSPDSHSFDLNLRLKAGGFHSTIELAALDSP